MIDDPVKTAADQEAKPEETVEPARDDAETLNRRRLIARYGKYAAVGIPLLLFASKAEAIHSKPL